MARKMPPLNPLHVFEASARLGSFTKAAEELGVTQSAVSRQVAVLEAYVRQRLFRRDRRGIALTPAGEAYRKDIAPAFARVASPPEARSIGRGRRPFPRCGMRRKLTIPDPAP
jgi:LysR family glycine cleavage system transcriptional activator